ncbi:MAG TPA: nitroreductase family protein [Xanthobacteraceae bacterium]|nr:nitroreductase family protein [Xanthobacteraceae bacterium]
MANDDIAESIRTVLFERFGEQFAVDPRLAGLDALARIAGHRSHRRYAPRAVAPDLLRLLCACALSAPSKSDLQQADIVVVDDAAIRRAIVATIPDMPWILDAPVFLVFAANGARLPALSELRGKPFPNDHLDQFFNATVDAAIVMTTFIHAAATVGLGCCPISAIRDRPHVVSDALNLPDRIIPVAGLCVGWPAQAGEVTPRLSLRTTLIEDAYAARALAEEIDAYDRRRAALRPYRRQRNVASWGETQPYGWSEDKARQYAEPTRSDFGRFVRGKGFCLD